MKKILVPTDFSEHANYAAKVAASIAKKSDARIYFLHVVDLPVYDTNTGIREHQDVVESLFIMKQVKAKFNQLFQEEYLEGVNAVEVLSFSGVHENIAMQVEKHQIDLIVMGSHGASGWKDIFLGSNTEKIVRLVNCPVITVKSDIPNFNPKKIVFSSSFDGDDDQAFTVIEKVTNLFDPEIQLLKVITPSTFEPTWQSQEKLNLFADRANLGHCRKIIYNAFNIEEGILSYCQANQIDLICTGTHGKSGLALLFGGSVATDLVNHSNLAVLTAKIPQIPEN